MSKKEEAQTTNYFQGYTDARLGSKRSKKNEHYLRGYLRGAAVSEPLVIASKGSNYFFQALAAITGCEPPFELPSTGTNGMPDQDYLELQDWASCYARPSWTTGLSTIEAAELLVAGAIENGNIDLK
jgi:hypothetical protein